MKIDITKNTIWLNSNGSKADCKRVVMFHRLLLDRVGYDDSCCMELSENGKGISIGCSSWETIKEMRENCNWLKDIIKADRLTPTIADGLQADKLRHELGL